jgi:DNA-directed RNA polymerase specialized sigma24 family protein
MATSSMTPDSRFLLVGRAHCTGMRAGRKEESTQVFGTATALEPARTLESRTGRRSPVRWQLTAEAFQRLLTGLGGDEAQAAAGYERLRRRLVAYFDARGCGDADVCADETLDRVARRLQQGEHIASVSGYAHGVARHVALEALRRQQLKRKAIAEWPRLSPAEGADEALFAHLEAQIRSLPADAGTLLMEYYRSDEPNSRRRRRCMANRLGISYGALKMRIHRARLDLEAGLRANG